MNETEPPRPFQQERIREPRRGRVVRVGPGREVWVDYPGNPHGPLRANFASTLDVGSLQGIAPHHPEVVLLFEDGDPARPLLLMVVEPPSETPLTDAVLDQSLSRVPVEARLDGERVVLAGRREVVLECGKARLTLRRDGTVILRGVNILTEADEVQRIRGSKVRIN